MRPNVGGDHAIPSPYRCVFAARCDRRGPGRRRRERLVHRSRQVLRFRHQLGKRYLSEGQVLDIEVLNVDLAGYVKPTRNGDLRFVRGRADWPIFQLRYKLAGAGQVVKQGEERVADLNYTGHLASYGNRDPLRYEKQMLDGWFKARFSAPQ